MRPHVADAMMLGMAATTVGAATREWRLGRRPGLDQLRGIAVLIVAVGHSAGVLGLATYAGAGVDVFFVLSGFLITRLLLEERARDGGIGYGRFYGRRARRLLPALGVALVLAAMVNVLIGAAILAPIGAAVTYTANYAQAARPEWGGATRHLWSLAIEEHFYLFWPLVVAVTPRRLLLPVCVGGAGLVMWWRFGAITDGHVELAYRATHLRADGLIWGAALACVAPWLGRPSRIAVAMGGAILAGVFLFTNPSMWWSSSAAYLATAVLLAAAMDARPRAWLERIGHLSYGIYLYHGVAIVLAAYFLPPVLAVAVAAVVGWCLAVFSAATIEARWRSGAKPLTHERAVGGGVQRRATVLPADQLEVVAGRQ